MKCELQVIRETWRVRTDFERIAGCFRYVNDQTTDRAGFLVHKILFLVLNSRIYCGRSPHGERGLKYLNAIHLNAVHLSLPTRGAWIEICARRIAATSHAPSLPTRGAWIEISVGRAFGAQDKSLPTRGAWIEIQDCIVPIDLWTVAPHTGSVD